MKGFTTIILASWLAVVSAAPANKDAACPAAAAAAAAPTANTSSCTTYISTVLPTSTPTPAAAATAVPTGTTGNSTSNTGATGTNIQAFTGTLGGAPPPVTSSSGDRPFSVNGNTFVSVNEALGRSCDIQHNACANAANSGELDVDVEQCDEQNDECHAANNLKKTKRFTRDIRPTRPKRAALDLGSCTNANILFEAGLDGRDSEAFIAANQEDFNHGSALNIAVVAGFICQRLGSSPCNAPADVQASCTQASAAAVATTQDQAAADAWNAIMGDGTVGGGSASSNAEASLSPAVPTITPAPNAAASPVPGVQVVTIISCTS